MSVHFWSETAAGVWKLVIEDKDVIHHNESDWMPAFVEKADLILFGTFENAND